MPMTAIEMEKAFAEGQQAERDLDHTLAYQKFLLAAENGHVGSQYHVALKLRYSEGVLQNFAEAKEWFLKVKMKENSGYDVDPHLEHLEIADKKFKEAYALFVHPIDSERKFCFDGFSKLANFGCLNSQSFLATCYLEGIGTRIDKRRAYQLFLSAAEMGHPRSAYFVAVILSEGIYEFPDKQDLVKAKEWFAKARQTSASVIDDLVKTKGGIDENILAWAKREYGRANRLLQLNKALAIRVLEEVIAFCGHNDSKIKLAEYYWKGIGVTKDIEFAYDMLLPLAEEGERQAQLLIVTMLLENDEGIEKNLQSALAIFDKRKAESSILAWTERKYSEANNKLLMSYGPSIKFAAIETLRQIFSIYGHTKSKIKLAECYWRGLVVTQDQAYAYHMILPLAEKGEGQAQLLIATMLENGEGVEKNPQSALEWFEKAGKNNSSSADELYFYDIQYKRIIQRIINDKFKQSGIQRELSDADLSDQNSMLACVLNMMPLIPHTIEDIIFILDQFIRRLAICPTQIDHDANFADILLACVSAAMKEWNELAVWNNDVKDVLIHVVPKNIHAYESINNMVMINALEKDHLKKIDYQTHFDEETKIARLENILKYLSPGEACFISHRLGDCLQQAKVEDKKIDTENISTAINKPESSYYYLQTMGMGMFPQPPMEIELMDCEARRVAYYEPV